MDVYLVGGAVRDALLGLPVHDRDYVVVGAEVEEMLAAGYRQVGRDFPVFLHPDTGEEYALARTERKSGRGHRGFAFAFSPDVSLAEDLRRRDLTVNAMAQDGAGNIIDPYGGQADIAARRLRHVSEAFVEDPLRVLRLLRFEARFAALGFEIAEETRNLCCRMAQAGELAELSAERVWQETEKALQAAAPERYFRGLAEMNAVNVLTGAAVSHDWQAAADALAATAARSADPAARLAFWTQGDAALIAALKAHLPLPKRYVQWLERRQAEGGDFAVWRKLGGERRWQLLKICGALREDSFLRAYLQAAGIEQALQMRILAAQSAMLQSVDAKQFAAQGLSGAALGAALQAAQTAVLEGQ